MTGTSLDSVDTALCKFYQEDGKYKFDLINYNEYELNREIRALILRIIDNNASIKELSQLNFYLAHLFADCSRRICSDINFNFDLVDLVSIHGQTIWHNPIPELFVDRKISSTLQLTSISALSTLLQKEVIGDFRSADIALGGHGAPIIPLFDYHFLKIQSEDVVALNIGGIANCTIMLKQSSIDDIQAFDIGPGNMLIDIAMSQFYDKNFDKNGETANSGMVIDELMDKLKSIEYIYSNPPKSTGRELFNESMINNFLIRKYKAEDVIRTLTEFTVYCIVYHIKKYAPINSTIIVSGGGRKNLYLVKLLINQLKYYKISLIDDYSINGDAKEAICFAFMGYINILNIGGNLPKITGSSSKLKLGISASNFIL